MALPAHMIGEQVHAAQRALIEFERATGVEADMDESVIALLTATLHLATAYDYDASLLTGLALKRYQDNTRGPAAI